MRAIPTCHGDLLVPAFLPDATRAVVKTVDATDLANCGVKGLMVNALHLSTHPGASIISAMGGIHRFMGWDGPLVSDSGGFQVYSLVAQSPKMGNVSHRGFTYRLEKGQKIRRLTPEKCIQKQFQIGSDIMFCLDHCTHPEEEQSSQRESVDHTMEWARACKEEFSRQLERCPSTGPRPLLFAVIQGGNDQDLRRRCAERLLEIGFDGYGYGGWPIDAEGKLIDMVGFVAELIPEGLPKHALGIGKPENLVSAFYMGYNLFDCAIPTRDARRRRLYVLNGKLEHIHLYDESFYRYLYIDDEKHARDHHPVDETCDCLCCHTYSRAYLHHLFRINDSLGNRLATLHNLRFYNRLMEYLHTVAC